MTEPSAAPLEPPRDRSAPAGIGLRLPGDTSPIEREYRSISDAMVRCTRTTESFDATLYSPDALHQARELWRVRMIAEYRSTTVFSQLAAQLMEARASIDSVGVVLRMALDEVRHAEICGRVVIALGGQLPVEHVGEAAPLTRHAGISAEERALRNVIYGCCLSEIVNTARFVDTIDAMTDPYLRDVTRQLLSDEVLHGQFGFHYLESWRDWLEQRPEIRGSLTRYLRHAFAVLEKQLSGAGAPIRVLTSDERALGLPDPTRLPETFYQTITGAVVPGLERFGIDAGTAWVERKIAT